MFHRNAMSAAAAFLAAVLAAATGSPARADVRLPGVFGDHAVLQRDVEVPVWGWADPGEKVTVKFGPHELSATADADGNWRVKLPALKASAEPAELTAAGKNNTVAVKDVVVGDVWLCWGQSNLGIPLVDRPEWAKADFPAMRQLTVKGTPSAEPQKDADCRWLGCSPGTAMKFSAVAYYFGKEIHETQKVPVGLIRPGAGNGVVSPEIWTSKDGMDKHARWERDQSRGFNGALAPIIPFAIRGALCYQGETFAGYNYRFIFLAMLKDWRRAWGQGDFPIVFVQLPGYASTKPGQPGKPSFNPGWALTRESQAQALALPNTAMAVTIDLGDKDLHPREKAPFGHRAALAARALAYGEKVASCAPLYDSMKAVDGTVRVEFRHVDGGGLAVPEGEPAKGFLVAGEDRKFAPADAQIDGAAVLVGSKDVPNPVAVRYAWADNPACNVFDKAGLPLAPFRTDDWMTDTPGK